MAVIVLRGNARAAARTGVAGLRATACGMVQRAMACAAAAVMAGAVGAALLQLVAQVLSFPAPIAVTVIMVMAAAVLHSLRRHLRTRRATRTRTRMASSGQSAES